MSTDVGSRFQHLLQPIRDLSKVWNIEIAEELEKYIDEVSSLSFQDEQGSRRLNFAEAALLIQGSTAIYSRKVEQLYALVYQALATCQLSCDKEKGVDGQPRKKAHTGLWAPIPDTDELLTIDHLIKEGRNITLDDAALHRQEQRQLLHRRLPLFLMPRDKTEGKQEFRIGSCTVHSSGAYLLQESDSRMLDEMLRSGEADRCNEQRSPLAPPPPQEVRDLDERLQELLRGLPGGPAGLPESPQLPEEPPIVECSVAEEVGLDRSSADAIQPSAGSPANHNAPSQPTDPWALLDEDDQLGSDFPCEVGSCTKRLGNKRLLAKGEGLPRPGVWEPLSDAELWRPGHAADGFPALMAHGHPVEAIFLAVARHLRNGGRSETQKAGFSAAWLEFEDLFEAASAKRRHGRGKAKQLMQKFGMNSPSRVVTHGEHSDEDCEAPPCEPDLLQITPLKYTGSAEIPTELSEEEARLQEQRLEVAKLEGLIEDAQTQYETSIRNQLQLMQGGADAAGGKYPEIYENVRRWQEQITPVLKELESHPEFEIDSYREKFLGKIVGLKRKHEEFQDERTIPFSRLVYGQPRWEVCRRFLTCLILTNQGNTDITFDDEGDRLNNFKVKLLDAETKPILFEEEEAPAPVPITTSERYPAEASGAATISRPAKRLKTAR